MKAKGCNVSLLQSCEYCCSTSAPLFSKAFYLFPCGHGYHSDCLVKLYLGEKWDKSMNTMMNLSCSMSNTISGVILDPQQHTHIKNIVDQLTSLTKSYTMDKRINTQIEVLQNELDGYISSDCPLCGELMVKLLDVSLVNTNTARDILEAKTWEL